MLSFLGFNFKEMQAQADGYFTSEIESRSPDAMGLSFDGFSGQFGQGFYFGSFDGQQGGFGFDGFTGDYVPVSSGLFLMTALGFIYIMNKRRKENE